MKVVEKVEGRGRAREQVSIRSEGEQKSTIIRERMVEHLPRWTTLFRWQYSKALPI
jgi:hypothetical protein